MRRELAVALSLACAATPYLASAQAGPAQQSPTQQSPTQQSPAQQSLTLSPPADDLLADASGTSNRCYPWSCGQQGAADHPPGAWAGIGSRRRLLGVSTRAVASPERLPVVTVLELRGAIPDVLLPHANMTMGLTLPVAFGEDGVTARTPEISLGAALYSRCHNWRIDAWLSYLPPELGGWSPAEVRLALDATLTDAADQDVLYLPRTDWGALRGHVSVESRVLAPQGFAWWVEGTLRAGLAKTATWLGARESFIGGLRLASYLGSVPWGLRFGVRAAIGLGGAWPANEVFPFTVEGVAAWSPITELSIEASFGYGGLAQSQEGGLGRSRGSLTLTVWAG